MQEAEESGQFFYIAEDDTTESQNSLSEVKKIYNLSYFLLVLKYKIILKPSKIFSNNVL